jgi:hypothetical protein
MLLGTGCCTRTDMSSTRNKFKQKGAGAINTIAPAQS